MISEETRKNWQHKIDRLFVNMEYNTDLITEWEYDFLVSINSQLNMAKDLSFKQSKTLNRIYEKMLSKGLD
jgi:hypothetical protein